MARAPRLGSAYSMPDSSDMQSESICRGIIAVVEHDSASYNYGSSIPDPPCGELPMSHRFP